MQISAVFSSGYQPKDPTDLLMLTKKLPTWGSWSTWRSCGTQNVVCWEQDQCEKLLRRAFQSVCNFYIPKKLFVPLNRPNGVKFFDGDFDRPVQDVDDIIAMHLAASTSDLVLLFGFDLSTPQTTDDVVQRHKIINRHGLLYNLLHSTADQPWVLVDCTHDIDVRYLDLANLQQDNMDSVNQMLETIE